jgi:hypothetical protein
VGIHEWRKSEITPKKAYPFNFYFLLKMFVNVCTLTSIAFQTLADDDIAKTHILALGCYHIMNPL